MRSSLRHSFSISSFLHLTDMQLIRHDSAAILSIYDHRDVQKDVIPSNAAAFQHYLGAGNPLPRPLVNDPDAGAVIDPTSSKEEESVVNYFEYRYGDAAFFILDTTAFQSLDDAEEDRTILGQTQFAVLEEWIQRVNQTVTWKFVVSSIPMMTLWRGGWSECMEERERVLDLLEYVPNVVVISAVSPRSLFSPFPFFLFDLATPFYPLLSRCSSHMIIASNELL